MPLLLFVSHAPSANTRQLEQAALNAIAAHTDEIEVIHKAPGDVTAEDGLRCDGLLLGTLENIGYMSGLTKDMFDRCYHDWLDRMEGRPAAIYIRAGHDGTATSHALSAISTGLRWRLVQPPLVMKGAYHTDFEHQIADFAAGFAAGVEQGIF